MAVIILNSKPKKAKSKYKRLKPVNNPTTIADEARRTMKRMAEPMKQDINLILEQMRRDNTLTPAEVGRRLENIRKTYEEMFAMNANQLAKSWVDRVNLNNRKKTMAQLREALGIDVGTILNEDMRKELDIMMLESATYIKTIPTQLVGKVAERVLQHYKGIQFPENRTLQGQIKEEFKVSDNRAKVLARDQTAKMNTSISAIRQNDIGIEMYIWRTVQDERVVGKPGGRYPKGTKLHKNHYIMEGKYCMWKDPTVYSDDKGKTWKKRTENMPKNHPGDDIMCRCRPEAVIDIEKLRVKWAE